MLIFYEEISGYGSCSYPEVGSVSIPTTTPTSATGTEGGLPLPTTTPTTVPPLTTTTPGTPGMPGNFSGGIFGGLDPSGGSSDGVTTTDGTAFIDGGSFLIKAGKCSLFLGFVLYSVILW